MTDLGQKIIRKALGAQAPAQAEPTPPPEIRRGIDILNAHYPEPRWAVPQLVPEEATVMAGRPKTCKSWIALNLALAIGHGGVALGRFQVKRGSVLYLALEDSYRRLQQRLRLLLAGQKMAMPEAVEFATNWPRPARGGIDHLDAWLTGHPDARLIVIDTWARFRDPLSLHGNVYQEDYMAFAEIQKLAIAHSTAILAITHTTKPKAVIESDPLDEVMGSTGITGAADAILVLKRPRMSLEASLFLTGRDMEERRYRIIVDKEHCLWTAEEEDLEDPDAGCTIEQRQTLDVMRNAARPIKPAEVAKILGIDPNTVTQRMRRMHEAGMIVRPRHGIYDIPCHTASLCHSDEMTHSDALRTPFDK